MTAADLLAWRNGLGLTQPEAAAALNTPLGTYRRWEQGTRRVPGIVDVTAALLANRRQPGGTQG
jgi:DNA-binding transcriptional regulator YiaG